MNTAYETPSLPPYLYVVFSDSPSATGATVQSARLSARRAESGGLIASFQEVMAGGGGFQIEKWFTANGITPSPDRALVLLVGQGVFLAPDAVGHLVRRYLVVGMPCVAREVAGEDAWRWTPYSGALTDEQSQTVQLVGLKQFIESNNSVMSSLAGSAVCEPAARWTRVGDTILEGPVGLATFIVRLSGRSPELLPDALLTLQAQQAGNGVNVLVFSPAEQVAEVRTTAALYDELPDSSPVSVLLSPTDAESIDAVINELNEHVIVFNDEDTVGIDWWTTVGTALFSDSPELMRTPVRMRRVQPELWPSDQEGFRVGEVEGMRGGSDYSQIQHLIWDEVPLCGWVFAKSYLASNVGVLALESTNPVRDWALSLHAGLDAVEVLKCEASVTHHYWEGGDSGHFQPGFDREADERELIDSLNAETLRLGPGALVAIRSLHDRATAAEREWYRLKRIESSRFWRLSAPIRGVWAKLRRMQ